MVFFIIRLLFYYYNQSSDVGNVPFSEKAMAFRMGLEFDTAVYCWIAFFPTLLWSIAYFFNQKRFYTIGYYGFLALQLLYHLICIADIPYFKQFGNHLNKGAFLWSESPDFAVGVIFGSFSDWGFCFCRAFAAGRPRFAVWQTPRLAPRGRSPNCPPSAWC